MKTTLDDVVATLNRLLAADPHAARALVDYRTPCNEELSDDPTIQVGDWDGELKVGMLGVLNGLFPTNDLGYGVLCAEFDHKSGKLERFRKTSVDDWDNPDIGVDVAHPCSQDTSQ